MPQFQGFDHIDTRVRSIKAVEPFYDRLMPELGLSKKTYSYVDSKGDWHSSTAAGTYNTVEYLEEPSSGNAAFFIGFIEDPAMVPTGTRIAFRVSSLQRWMSLLKEIGAANIELSESMEEYSAIFFEDPAGTKLELTTPQVKKSAIEYLTGEQI